MSCAISRITRGLSLLALLALGACANVEPTGPDTPWYAFRSANSTRLWGTSQVPPVSTPGRGSVEAHLNRETRLLSWTIRFSDLSGPVTAAHFHGPAMPGENAPPVVPITDRNLSSPIQGSAVLTPEQAADFLAGKWYLNLHTAAYPDGELRGQIPARP